MFGTVVRIEISIAKINSRVHILVGPLCAYQRNSNPLANIVGVSIVTDGLSLLRLV